MNFFSVRYYAQNYFDKLVALSVHDLDDYRIDFVLRYDPIFIFNSNITQRLKVLSRTSNIRVYSFIKRTIFKRELLKKKKIIFENKLGTNVSKRNGLGKYYETVGLSIEKPNTMSRSKTFCQLKIITRFIFGLYNLIDGMLCFV